MKIDCGLDQPEERHLALYRSYSLIASLIPPKIAVFDPAVKGVHSIPLARCLGGPLVGVIDVNRFYPKTPLR